VKRYDDNPLAYVDDSAIHGKGLFARADIPADTFVGSYEGPATDEDGMHVLWVWNDERDAWEGIDGKNEMRFLNHSADPNAEWWGNELYSIRSIAEGEEITFHYGEDWE
jgi:hypothetical protein